jgi:hypothetical protein
LEFIRDHSPISQSHHNLDNISVHALSNDGKQSYVDFINKSLTLLKPEGVMALIIPTLWMKPDKAGLYNTMTTKNFTIKKMEPSALHRRLHKKTIFLSKSLP